MSTGLSRYLGLFVQEATEHLEALGRDVVRVEREGASAPVIDGMFRHAHTVKGMAASMGFSPIALLAHRLEDLLDRLRTRPSALTPELADVALATVDALLVQVRTAAREEPIRDAPELHVRLAAKIAGLGSSGPAAVVSVPPGVPLPPASPAPAASASPPSAPAAPASRAPVPAVPATPPPEAGAAAPSIVAAPVGLEVRVRIAESCAAPGVRAFLVHKKLEAIGPIVAAEPSLADCRAGRVPGGRLRLQLAGPVDEAAVRQALDSVPELAQLELGPAPSPAPIASVPPPAAAALQAPAARAAAGPAAPVVAAADTDEAPGRDGPAASTVRVSTALLDRFLDSMGELLLATARLRELGRGLPDRHRRDMVEGLDGLHRIVKELHGRVLSVRMTPVALLTDRLPRVARDLARQLGREVELGVEGAEIELDRAVIEQLGDALLHVIRNCVDHGLEPPEERRRAGKPPRGRISVRARRDRDRVILEVEDDGRGFDPARLREAAVARGVLSAQAAAALSDAEALGLACLPGVSTSATVSDVSGRGVGLDAVKRSVEDLGGSLELASERGRGARFRLHLPRTVAVQQVLLVGLADEVFGLPIAQVLGAVEVSADAPIGPDHARRLRLGGELVPVRALARLLALPAAPPPGLRPHVLVQAEGGRIALEVDRLVGQQEAVLKPLPALLDLVPGLSGVTLLGTGRPVFLLDVPRLLASASGAVALGAATAAPPDAGAALATLHAVLVAAAAPTADALGRLIGLPVTATVEPATRPTLPPGDGVAVTLQIARGATGSLCFLAPAPVAQALAARLLGAPVADGLPSPAGESALAEVANILGSALLSALGERLGRALLPSVPSYQAGDAATLLGPDAPPGFELAFRCEAPGAPASLGSLWVSPADAAAADWRSR